MGELRVEDDPVSSLAWEEEEPKRRDQLSAHVLHLDSDSRGGWMGNGSISVGQRSTRR